MKQKILSSIAAGCALNISHSETVSGGDINKAYCLYAGEARYFLKMNDAGRFPLMFEKEADGLKALRDNSSLRVPEVVQHGIEGHQQWLLLQWIEKSSPAENTMQNFGAALANMHQHTQTHFGWHTDNYIGSLQQANTFCLDWPTFYAQHRLLPLVKTLFDARTFTNHDCRQAEALCNRMESIFPKEPPALLHGDLWSGNYMVTTDGVAAIFDPAVYYGHREMDIGMTALFGGFNRSFYEGYNQVYQLENGWQERLSKTQLYPVMVHAVLFGGHYIENARQIING